MGNPVSRTWAGQNHTFTCNLLNQHTGATGPDKTHVTGLWSTAATSTPVSVAVNGLPATISPTGRWWREDVPLYPLIKVATAAPRVAKPSRSASISAPRRWT